MIIAIDGPAGAGKSTIARNLAKKLRFLYIDTGAMYRALTLKIINNKIDANNKKAIYEIAKNTSIGLKNKDDFSISVSLDGADVSNEIRHPKVTKLVSDIAKIKEVREVMVELQRKLGKSGNCVLDGRDIGTVVFPDADKKFYLDADFKERVNRRFKELVQMGQKISPGEVEADLSNRDTIDSTRKIAPLKKADDAIYIDTTNMTIEEVIEAVFNKIGYKE